MGISQKFSFKNSTVPIHCPAMRVRLLRSKMVAENIDAATCDMELLDPVNVSGVFGISFVAGIEAEMLRYFICASGNGGHL